MWVAFLPNFAGKIFSPPGTSAERLPKPSCELSLYASRSSQRVECAVQLSKTKNKLVLLHMPQTTRPTEPVSSGYVCG